MKVKFYNKEHEVIEVVENVYTITSHNNIENHVNNGVAKVCVDLPGGDFEWREIENVAYFYITKGDTK